VACGYNRYSSKPYGEITFLRNQNTIIVICGTPLQLLHNIVLSRYHRQSSAPHGANVVVAFLGVPLQLDAGMGIENHIITTFPTSCSSTPTNATTKIPPCGVPL
jgi:hypothetical protein